MRNIVFGLVFFSVLLGLRTAEAKYSGGTGEAANPYRISDYNDLYALADDTNDYNQCFVMTADIDLDPNLPGRRQLATALIAPDINDDSGFQGTAFTGTFDGNDWNILNLTIDTNGLSNDYLGLFGKTEASCAIESLGIEEVRITSGAHLFYLGGLVGRNNGSIRNCHVTGAVTADDFAVYVGGLVGSSSAGSITSCYATGSVSAGYNAFDLGGLVGFSSAGSITSCHASGDVTCGGDCLDVGGLVGNNYASITDCYATGDVNAPGGFWGVGGLVGSNGDDATPGGSITACYATGSVSSSHAVGGLVGLNAGGAIAACYAAGAVSGSYGVGGLVGWNARCGLEEFVYGSVTDSYATGSVNGGGYVGGLAGDNDGPITSSYFLDPNDGGGPDNGYGEPLTDTEMKTEESFVGWDFDDVWKICEGEWYPQLTWEKYAGGLGTEENPYLIRTSCDLNDIGNHPNDFDKHFVMVSDINLAGYIEEQFNIIGYDEVVPFTGVFDGNGHAIHNFSYYTSEGPDPEGIGLFGYVNDPNAEIKNLELVGPYLRAQVSGTLVGYLVQGTLTSCSVKEGDIEGIICGMLVLENGGTIRKCSATGSMVGPSSGGLVVGNVGTIEDCVANVSVLGWEDMGGFIAYNQGTIRRSFSEGEAAAFRYGGGFAAWNYGTITDCYSTAYVRGTGISAKYLGGFLAENHGTIENCYSTGQVYGGLGYKGGFIANNPSGTVLNSFWDVNTSEEPNSAGGTGLTTTEMQMESTFTDAGWDFDDVWAICEGTNYPRHIWSIPAADFVCPDGVNFIDYSFFSEVWLADTCGVGNDFCSGRDLDESGVIDEEDLKILCGYWLDGI